MLRSLHLIEVESIISKKKKKKKFCITFHIFVVGGDRDLKFSRQVDRRKYETEDEKSSMKGAWSDHVNHLHFGEHQPYLWNG